MKTAPVTRSETRAFLETPALGMGLLSALVFIGPWLNGGADALPQWILFVFATAIASCLIHDVYCNRDRFWISWMGVITWMGCGLILFHLLPIWSVEKSAIAPAAVHLRSEMTAHGDADRSLALAGSELEKAASESDLPRRVTWTLDGHATRQMLALVGLALLALTASSRWIRSVEQLDRLAKFISWNGVLLTLFAVLAKATWNGKLYWFIPVGFGRGVFGSMIYHNLAGSILLMTCAASLYALLRGKQVRQAAIKITGQHVVLAAPHRWQWPDAPTLVEWIVCGVNIAGLLLTLSRGALLAFIAASLFALLILRPRTHWRDLLLPLGCVVLGVAGLLIWFRASDAVSRRYSTLMQSEQLLADVRLDHWNDGARAGWEYGLLGVGSGAYRHIHPLFQDSEIERTFLRAHNQYLETWVDSGLPGLVFLITALIMACMLLRWLIARRELALRHVAMLGLIVTLSQIIHAGVDFCLYLPAVAIMYATIMGAIVGVAWHGCKQREQSPKMLGLHVSKPIFFFTSAALWSLTCWSTWVGAIWAREETAVYRIPWNKDNRSIENDKLTQAIRSLEAFSTDTDDWRVPLALGELYLLDYRLRLSETLRGELTPEESEVLTDDELWELTDPMVLLARSHELSAKNDRNAIESEIRTQPLIAGRLAQAHNQFRLSRKLCPMIAQVQLRLGELAFIRQEYAPHDFEDLFRAERIAIGNADLQYEIGRRFAVAGQDAKALGAWRQSLTLSHRHWPDIYRLVGNQLTPQQMLDSLLPVDPKLYLSIVGRQFTEPEQQSAKTLYIERAEALLGPMPLEPRKQAAWHLTYAELELLRNDRAEAIEHLSAAVKVKAEDHALRAQLAELLALESRWEEALREARYCLGLQPNNWNYRGLVDRIGREGRRER